jgi:hypothetical protein
LKDPRANPGDQNNEAIISAAESGHAEIVKTLLRDSRVNPGAQNNLALFSATQSGYTQVLQVLLDSKDPRIDLTRIDDILPSSNLDTIKIFLVLRIVFIF